MRMRLYARSTLMEARQEERHWNTHDSEGHAVKLHLVVCMDQSSGRSIQTFAIPCLPLAVCSLGRERFDRYPADGTSVRSEILGESE
jgi:hypothetical protein